MSGEADQAPVLRDYETTSLLARTAISTLWAGRQRLTGQPVALQCLLAELAAAPGVPERLGVAARRLANLDHPRVIPIYDVVAEKGTVCLVLELVRGVTLRSLMSEGALPPATAIAAADDLLAALQAAHAQGVVHGDVRPENVMVPADGGVRLGGFAVAEAVAAVGLRPAAGDAYADPARPAGQPPDAAGDVWAAAVLTHELLAGRPPENGRVAAGVPPALAAVLHDALAADASRREGSAAHLRIALLGAVTATLGPSWRMRSNLGERAASLLGPPATAAAAGPTGPPAFAAPSATAAVPGPLPGFRVPPPPGTSATAASSASTPRPPAPTPPAAASPPPPAAPSPPLPAPDQPAPSQPRRSTPAPDRHRRRVVALVAFLVVAAAAGATIGGLVAGGVIGGGGDNTGPLRIGDDVRLAASPAQGGCNTNFHFSATGTVHGVGTLVYRFERSDGSASADTSVQITSDEGSFNFTQDRRLQGSQAPQETVTFRIVSPTERTAQATVHYSCG
jgi:serine/threonine-protein kinase